MPRNGNMSSKHGRRSGARKAQAARSVGYGWESDGGFKEGPVEQILQAAKDAGLVVAFDTGRGHVVWFDGAPGPALRALRGRIRAMLPADARPLWQLTQAPPGRA